MPVTLPYSFAPETEADANHVMADLLALAAMFGNITNADISGTANIDGNKMSQTAGQRIPALAIADDAVTDRSLADDAGSPGSDTNRAVSGNHIKALTNAQVARILPASSGSPPSAGIGVDKLALVVHDRAGSAITVAAGLTTYNMAAWGEIASSNWRGVVTVLAGASPASQTLQQIVTPSVAFPSASYALLAVFPVQVAYAGTTINFTLRFVFMKIASA